MSTYHDSSLAAKPYKDPTPLPDNIPKVEELGTTSAPLKSAAFFIGAFCKEYNGMYPALGCLSSLRERARLISYPCDRGFYALQARKSGSRPLSQGRPTGDEVCSRSVRRVPPSPRFRELSEHVPYPCCLAFRITKMRENCLQQFDAHWNCLELHNQVNEPVPLLLRNLMTATTGILSLS